MSGGRAQAEIPACCPHVVRLSRATASPAESHWPPAQSHQAPKSNWTWSSAPRSVPERAMFGFPCRCVERRCYSCRVSLDAHLETQAVIKKSDTAHTHAFAGAHMCLHRLMHARAQPYTTKAHIQQRANTCRSQSKRYGQSVSSLTPEEWRVRPEGLGDSVSRRTLATRDGSKSEVDAPCLCVLETQSRT